MPLKSLKRLDEVCVLLLFVSLCACYGVAQKSITPALIVAVLFSCIPGGISCVGGREGAN